MKISQLTTDFILNYLRIDDASDIEIDEIEAMSIMAKSYITSFTGLTEAELDEYEDITHAFLLIVSDMFDNRNLYTENKTTTVNKAVECILKMHSINLM